MSRCGSCYISLFCRGCLTGHTHLLRGPHPAAVAVAKNKIKKITETTRNFREHIFGKTEVLLLFSFNLPSKFWNSFLTRSTVMLTSITSRSSVQNLIGHTRTLALGDTYSYVCHSHSKVVTTPATAQEPSCQMLALQVNDNHIR